MALNPAPGPILYPQVYSGLPSPKETLMQPETPILVQRSASTSALSQNRVLRNTYLLLALSMLPTVAGAWLGVQMKFAFFAGSPVIGFVLFLAIAFGFFYGIEKTKNSGWGVALLL